MLVSVHLAAPGARRSLHALRRGPDPVAVGGLTYAETVLTVPLGPALIPRPSLTQIGLIAGWESDEHLDSFLDDPALAGPFASGWHVRMQPVRVFGTWPAMPDLPDKPIGVGEREPVAVLTLGRPRTRRLPDFLRTSAKAEAELRGAQGLLASTGLAHPPRLVATFSLWRTAAEMRHYAQGQGGAHMAAVRSDRGVPFHHESAFIRLRPYRSEGSWGGSDPLASLLR